MNIEFETSCTCSAFEVSEGTARVQERVKAVGILLRVISLETVAGTLGFQGRS